MRGEGGQRQRRALLAQHGGELLVHHLHDLLAGRHRLQHPLAERLLFHALHELARDLVVDVRLQQHAADLPQPFADHGLREDPALPQAGEYALELVAELVEHRRHLEKTKTPPTRPARASEWCTAR
jgi:hypothetical protein